MKILVTGGTGFIGSHLIPELIERAYDVYNLERYITGRYAKPKKFKTVFGDLREHYTIKSILRRIRPEIVIHLASISPVSYSYGHYNEVLETNFLATANLAEMCLRELPNFKQFLFAGTSEEYGNNGYEVQIETNPLRPASPYAVSKVASEKYLNYMEEAYDFPVTILRPFNTYGRKKDYHFLIEKTVVHMFRQEKSISLGDPEPVSDWLYVKDHTNAYLTCLQNEKAIGETFNFCTGEGLTIKETVENIKNIIGFKGKISWRSIPARPSGSKIIIGSYEKAKKTLGWVPKFSFKDGLKETIEHWKRRN